jgi:hypothetical protein
LALIVATSAVRKNSEKTTRQNNAKFRAEMRRNSADAWEASVPTPVVHTDAPIDFDTSVRVDDDITDSQYAIIKTIFETEHPDKVFLSKYKNVPVIDYWGDTTPGRIE